MLAGVAYLKDAEPGIVDSSDPIGETIIVNCSLQTIGEKFADGFNCSSE